MICKFTLSFDGKEYELDSDCISNWGDIKCTLERKDYSGVTRSFSTQFDFTNKAYRLLKKLYQEKGIYAIAYIAVYVINNRWVYDKLFENRLDFSTLTDDGRILSLNSVDNSLAAIIKAKKSTKYEFVVEDEFRRITTLQYDRVAVRESVSFQVIGDSISNSSAMRYNYEPSHGDLVVCNSLSDEISIGGQIDYQDEDVESGSYLIKALKDVTIDIDYLFATDRLAGYDDTGWKFGINKIGAYGNTLVEEIHINGKVHSSHKKTPSGGEYFTSVNDLESLYPEPEHDDWALVGSSKEKATVWNAVYNGRYFYWQDTGQDEATYGTKKTSGTLSVELSKGDKLYVSINTYGNSALIRIIENKITFSWKAIGDTIGINCLKPADVISTLVNKMTYGFLNVDVDISTYDSRLADTFLIAAESIRGIDKAKLYSTFNEFCTWMETVFGYTYYIGSREKSKYDKILNVGHYEYTPREYFEYVNKSFDSDSIYYIQYLKKFLVRDDNGIYYESWNGSGDYIDSSGRPRQDKIFYMETKSNGSKYVYFDENGNMYDYEHDVTKLLLDTQTLHFVHRKELFRGDIIKDIDNATDVKYSIDSSLLYSRLCVGYDKQDYDSINGRDEWNFANEYSTEADMTDKTFDLKSKYRADCYGFEFTAQKRGEDSTDNESDNNIFFVLLKQTSNGFFINRNISIGNALSDTVFNGIFSPIKCIEANVGYLGAMQAGLTLKFASSEGNSDIIIDGENIAKDIILTENLFTAGEVNFTTDDMDIPNDWNTLVRISNMGTVYTGYIKKAEMKLGKQYGIEYTLIVKSVEYDN